MKQSADNSWSSSRSYARLNTKSADVGQEPHKTSNTRLSCLKQIQCKESPDSPTMSVARAYLIGSGRKKICLQSNSFVNNSVNSPGINSDRSCAAPTPTALHYSAPTGRHSSAQGKALSYAPEISPSPERAAQTRPAPSGLEIFSVIQPRALPWADESRAFSASIPGARTQIHSFKQF